MEMNRIYSYTIFHIHLSCNLKFTYCNKNEKNKPIISQSLQFITPLITFDMKLTEKSGNMTLKIR